MRIYRGVLILDYDHFRRGLFLLRDARQIGDGHEPPLEFLFLGIRQSSLRAFHLPSVGVRGETRLGRGIVLGSLCALFRQRDFRVRDRGKIRRDVVLSTRGCGRGRHVAILPVTPVSGSNRVAKRKIRRVLSLRIR
jgi:hypothetical protein